MFVNVSPAVYNMNETVCSLTFAARCRATELGQAKKQSNSSSSNSNNTSNNSSDSMSTTQLSSGLAVPSSNSSTTSTSGSSSGSGVPARIMRPPLSTLGLRK